MDDFPSGFDLLVAFLVFAVGWIYAIATYGFFLVVGSVGFRPYASQ